MIELRKPIPPHDINYDTTPYTLQGESADLMGAIKENNLRYIIYFGNQWYIKISGQEEELFYIKMKFGGDAVE